METREMLDHDAISEFEEQEEDMPLIQIEKAKAEAVGEQQRKTLKEAPKPTPQQISSSPSNIPSGTSSTGTTTKKPTTVRDTTKSITKVSQNTSRSN
jgi:hypothetical protein